LGECPASQFAHPEDEGFSMTTSFSVTSRLGLAVAGCLAIALVASPVRAEDKLLAKVNGAEIHQSDVALAEEELGPSLAQMDPATKDENVLAFLIDMKIVAKAAEDKKVQDNEEFKKRLAFTRNRLLMDSLLASEGKAATNDEAMKKVYEEASKQITGEEEVHARHILVETEDEAKAVEEELRRAPISPNSPRRSRRILVPPTAATSASSPRTRWCRSSPRPPSRSSPARPPIPSSRSSAGTSSRSRRSASARPRTSSR